ncbi:hypothetical protein ACH5RR_041106 [Cinchona calisaya]|uniref:Uncharacterized protein n=1 Tax=Cinchona calisaya TaxID=153742 RepID=A0ABD2XSZ2_9GENT
MTGMLLVLHPYWTGSRTAAVEEEDVQETVLHERASHYSNDATVMNGVLLVPSPMLDHSSPLPRKNVVGITELVLHAVEEEDYVVVH